MFILIIFLIFGFLANVRDAGWLRDRLKELEERVADLENKNSDRTPPDLYSDKF